jgi:hypothetical protein
MCLCEVSSSLKSKTGWQYELSDTTSLLLRTMTKYDWLFCIMEVLLFQQQCSETVQKLTYDMLSGMWVKSQA